MSPKTHQVFRGNFVIAVWLSIATLAYQFADNVRHAHQITARFGWSGKDLKIILAPAILGGMLLISWFRFWRDAEAGGGVAAGFFGAGFVLLLVVQLLLPQVGVDSSIYLDAYYAYLAISFLGYGLGARRDATASIQ